MMTIEVFCSLIYIFCTAIFAMNYYSWVHKNDSSRNVENDRYGVLEMFMYMVFWPFFLIKLIHDLNK